MRSKHRRSTASPAVYIVIGILAAMALGLAAPADGWTAPGGDRGAPGVTIAGPARVIDGDTIVIQGTHIRRFGIDAPESRQTCSDTQRQAWACGAAATQALANRIGWRTVRCASHGLDTYGRVLGTCRAGDTDLNGWMVRSGLAVAYTHYSWAYFPDEVRARAARAGIWAGTFENPWQWRREHQEEQRPWPRWRDWRR